jgi:zinc protease
MFKKYQLKNGLKVLLVPSHKSPVLSIQMWVKTGSADEKKGEEGISHFIEHLVFKGSRKFDVGEIASTVEGAGGELNAYTSFDQTVFYVTISKEFQHVGLEVISEMMGFPRFAEVEIDNEREVVIEEIKRSNDSPHRQASRLLFSSMYRKHPYGIPVIGYADNIKAVSRKPLLNYYHSRYNPSNMTLVIAGDFEAPSLKKRIQEYFSGFPKNKLRRVKRPAIRKTKKPVVVVEKAPFNETIVHVAFPVPKASHKDIAALEVFALIVGQGDSSRLNRRLRLNEHLVNFAGASVFAARDPGFLAVSLSLNEKDLDRALSVLREELIHALSELPGEAELRKAITNLASEQFYSLETVDGLARSFGHYQDLFGDPSYFTKFMKQVQNLTAADIVKAARRYMCSSPPTVVVMSPVDREAVHARMSAWTKSFHTALGGLVGKNLVGKKMTGPASKARRTRFILNPPTKKMVGVEKWSLPNGVTVITRPSFDTPVLSVRCASLGGARIEDVDTQGATELLSRVWTAGCGDISETELSHRIEGMAASLSAFGGRNSVGLSMSCLRPFADDMVQLFCEVWNLPRFEQTAIQRETKAMIEQVKLRKDNPAQLCILAFMKGLFGDHPYGRDPYGDERGIGQLSRDKVMNIYSRRSGLTVVASGAFEPAELCGKIQKALADVRVGAGEVTTRDVDYPKKEVRLFDRNEKQQSHIVYGFPGLTLQDPQRYTLQVVQAILAGQGGRLFVELRDKASLAYSVSPLRMEGIEGGYFGAYIGCSPEKAETALRMMKEEFLKLAEKKVSPEELLRSQRYLIGKHDIELQKNSNITSAILFDHIYGIDFLETYKFAERIRAVTAESVRNAAARLFAQPAVISLVGPRSPW